MKTLSSTVVALVTTHMNMDCRKYKESSFERQKRQEAFTTDEEEDIRLPSTELWSSFETITGDSPPLPSNSNDTSKAAAKNNKKTGEKAKANKTNRRKSASKSATANNKNANSKTSATKKPTLNGSEVTNASSSEKSHAKSSESSKITDVVVAHTKPNILKRELPSYKIPKPKTETAEASAAEISLPKNAVSSGEAATKMSETGLATNSILFCFLFVKTH